MDSDGFNCRQNTESTQDRSQIQSREYRPASMGNPRSAHGRRMRYINALAENYKENQGNKDNEARGGGSGVGGKGERPRLNTSYGEGNVNVNVNRDNTIAGENVKNGDNILGGLRIQNSIGNRSKSNTNRGREKIKEYNQFLKNKYDNITDNKGFDENNEINNYGQNTEVVILKSSDANDNQNSGVINRIDRIVSRPHTKDIKRHNYTENATSSILSQGQINWDQTDMDRPKTQNYNTNTNQKNTNSINFRRNLNQKQEGNLGNFKINNRRTDSERN